MTREREEAEAALARSRAAREKAERQGTGVDRVVKSLNSQLETNGFSVRLARLFDLEDPRR